MERIKRDYLWFIALTQIPLSLVFPTYVIFLVDNGLSMAEVGVVNFAFMIGVFLLEVPTGVVADYFGRKTSVLLGVFFHALAALVYFVSYNTIGFIVAEVMCAFGSCFISGALDAWLKDSLDLNGYGHVCGQVFTRGEMVKTLGTIIGGTFGVALALMDLRLPWIVSALGLFAVWPICRRLIKEEYFVKKELTWKTGWQGMRRIVKDSVRYGWNHHVIFSLILICTLAVMAYQVINMNWSLYFSERFGLEAISWLWVLIMSATMFGTMIGGRLMCGKLGKVGVMRTTLFMNVVLFVLIAVVPQAGMVLFFFVVHELNRGAFVPAEKTFLQNNIASSDIRATVGSFKSMIVHAGAAAGWLASGVLLTVWSFETILFICAGLLAVAAVFAGKMRRD